MSIIDKIESITASRNTIRTKMVTAGQATRNDKLATLATNLSITDTSDATATAADIAEGKTAYVEGAKITGTSTKDADTSDATAVAGDILSGKTAYVDGAKVTGSITSKSAQTYTPGTTAQTIASGQYLSGTQTIQGSSALTSANIKQGTSIFGVTGTFTSDATATAEDIAEGKTAYVNGSKLVGTASGGGLDDSYRVILGGGSEAELSSIGWIVNNSLFNSSVTIGNNVTNCSDMFNNCSRFNQPITIPANVTYVDKMFYKCSNFNQPITIPNNVTSCTQMFDKCVNFNSSVIINDTGGKSAHYDSMFSGCSKFNQSITFPNAYVYFNSIFYNCNNFNKQIIFPYHTTSMVLVFGECKSFNSIVYVPWETSNIYSMLSGCTNFGNKVYINSTRIKDAFGLFRGCNNSKRKEIYFHHSLNNIFNISNSSSIVGKSISWSSMTNGFYNITYNIYCYNNYSA